MAQITYYAPAGVTSINLSDGSRAVVVGGQITVDSKFRNELEAAGCTAEAETDNAVRFTKTVTGGIIFSSGGDRFAADRIEVSDALDTPATVQGLALWLDASDVMYTAGYAAKAANSGDVVGVWPDKSGNAIDLTVSGSPTYSPDGLNGHPAVSFNGNSYFSKAGFFTAEFDTAWTAFAVVKQSVGAGLGIIFGTPDVSPSLWHQVTDTTKQFALRMSGVTTESGRVFNYLNSAHVQMSHFDGAELTLQSDRFCAKNGSTTSNTSYASLAATGTLGLAGLNIGIGALADGSYKYTGLIGELIIYKRALSTDERASVLKYLNRKWAFNRRLIVAAGNSLTSGVGSSGTENQAVSPSGTNYPAQLWNKLGADTWDMRIDAYPGRNLVQMLAENSICDALAPNAATLQPVVLVWEIVNTLTQKKSAAAAIQMLQRYCLARRLAGAKVAVFTCLPTTAAVYAGFESDRQVVNTFVRNNWVKFADALIDVAADPRLQNSADTTYFSGDKLHLTNAGYAVVADRADPVVRSL